MSRETDTDGAAPEASPSPESNDQGRKNRKRLTTGVAVGIGSAAIVAALLYANRSRKSDRGQ